MYRSESVAAATKSLISKGAIYRTAQRKGAKGRINVQAEARNAMHRLEGAGIDVTGLAAYVVSYAKGRRSPSIDAKEYYDGIFNSRVISGKMNKAMLAEIRQDLGTLLRWVGAKLTIDHTTKLPYKLRKERLARLKQEMEPYESHLKEITEPLRKGRYRATIRR